MSHRPPPHPRQEREACVRVDRGGVPDHGQQPGVEEAVGVRERCAQVDPCILGPFLYRLLLAPPPHERAVDLADVGAVLLRPPGGDDVVEADYEIVDEGKK